jgi:methyl-accepting chemotaxis protein
VRFSIGKKLMTGFISICLILGAVSLIAYVQIQKVDSSYSDLVDRRMHILTDAMDIQVSATRQISGLRGMMLQEAHTEESVSISTEEINKLIQDITPQF